VGYGSNRLSFEVGEQECWPYRAAFV
jgi:hypothetical protein